MKYAGGATFDIAAAYRPWKPWVRKGLRAMDDLSVRGAPRNIFSHFPQYPVSFDRSWLRPSHHILFETMGDIAEKICRRVGISLADLKGERRMRNIAHPRQEFMYRAYCAGRWSTPQIGLFLGGRDHTTVIHGIRRHAQRAGLPSPLKADQ